ncbi:MAG: biotin--[acetyl-CoA-carboxylase] ligase [Steroidobacteraceae bacterium]
MVTKSSEQSSARQQRLLAMLADGKFHSGEKLAAKLKVSRSAVWKLIRTLRLLGIEVQAVPKQGYRLPRAVDLYEASAILEGMPRALRSRLEQLDVLLQVDSTNHFLAAQAAPEVDYARVCVAEVQTLGKGRRGRTWVAPFGSGICFSLSFKFADSPPQLSALGLAVGVAVLRALDQFGAGEVGLKWPNDLVWRGRKLAGILIEVAGESGGPTRVVIGIGLNVHMPAPVRLALAEQQAALIADLGEILQGRLPSRNQLVAAVIEHLLAVLDEFATKGFAAFVAEWRGRDALANAPVKVLAGNESIMGTAQGVAEDGALLVDVRGERRQFFSAEVSLRAAR